MFYTVYKTTNTINGKSYIGAHRTEKLEDGYIGSGTHLRMALKKYGRSSFTKELLFVFDSPQEMSSKEAELVTREFVDREDTYNLVPGGYQGDSFYRTRKTITPEMMSGWAIQGNPRRKERFASDPEFGKAIREAGRRAILKAHSEGKVRHDGFKGRKHSDAALKRISEEASSRTGAQNSQFGSMWVKKSGESSKKIRKEDLTTWLNAGWGPGRTIT